MSGCFMAGYFFVPFSAICINITKHSHLFIKHYFQKCPLSLGQFHVKCLLSPKGVEKIFGMC